MELRKRADIARKSAHQEKSIGDLKEKLRLKARTLRLLADRLTYLEEQVLRRNRGTGSLDTVLRSEKHLLKHLEEGTS